MAQIGGTAETLHGVTVHDPYRSLEDAGSPAAQAWTVAQNRRTRRVLGAVGGRERLAVRLSALLDIGGMSVPVVRGDQTFYTARTGRADQAVLYVRAVEEAREAARALIDPAALDETRLTSLDWWYPAADGTQVAFGLSQGGDERSTLHVVRVADGRWLAEEIPHTRASSVAWLHDGSGFYYTRRPPGDDYNVRVFLHRLGTRWEDDALVFGEGRAPEDWLHVRISENGRWLIVSAERGWTANDAYICDLSRPGAPFATIVEGRDALYRVHPDGDDLYLHTDDGAPRFALWAVAADAPRAAAADAPAAADATLVVPQADDVLHDVAVADDGRLVLAYLRDAASLLRLRERDGRIRDLPLPAYGTVQAVSARERDRRAFVSYVSFTQAPTIYRLDVESGETAVWDRVAAPLDADGYRVEQHWFTSRDGTRVPMFAVRAASTPVDGTAPAVLTGYGGFNASLTPAFNPSICPWLDLGGVYAVANVRGGGEFGEEWHRAGMRERKQNSFDDFIAAAEALAASGYADRRRIGIVGGSNGGLLVAAAATQRPELFAAVVCSVPLCDMIRFPRFLIGRLWIAEYGDPDDPADFATLYGYSPYHRVRDGERYPAMLIVAGEADSRVDPMHARKFAARLQAATSAGEDAPILVLIEQQAGHGAGKPRWKQLDEQIDRWSFLAWRLSVELTRLDT